MRSLIDTLLKTHMFFLPLGVLSSDSMGNLFNLSSKPGAREESLLQIVGARVLRDVLLGFILDVLGGWGPWNKQFWLPGHWRQLPYEISWIVVVVVIIIP